MSIDLTLMDIAKEESCIRIIKKPNFIYADFHSQPDRCLLYIIDSKKAWTWDHFDGGRCRINEQTPRVVDAAKAISKLLPCREVEPGKTGVYMSPLKPFHAIKLKCSFHIKDMATGERKESGERGDWLISDGTQNRIVTEDTLKRFFVLDKEYSFAITVEVPKRRVRPNLQQEYSCFVFR